MLVLSTTLSNIPLLTIRTAGRIGTVIEPIINPHNLHIDAFYCQTFNSQKPLILLDIFVRELSPRGLIIDEHNNLSEPGELVRLEPVLKLQFKLEGKVVLSGKKKIGKVSEYAVDREGLFIQKLYVQPPVWQSINQNTLTIDRKSVLEVTDSYIRISGPEVKVTGKAQLKAPLLAKGYSTKAALIKE